MSDEDNNIFATSVADEADDKRLKDLAQALVDDAEAVSRRVIPITSHQRMNEIDIGGAGMSAALQAVLKSSQARALPDIAAISFSLGASFASIITRKDVPMIDDALQSFLIGFHQAIMARQAGPAQSGRA